MGKSMSALRSGLIGLLLTGILGSAALAVKVEVGQATPTAVPTTTALPISVQYQPVSETPKFGDSFILQVEISLDKQVVLEPIVYKDQLGDWEVLQVNKGQVECDQNGCKRIDRLTLTTFNIGQVEVPSIPFVFSSKGKKGEYRPLPITIKVDGLPPKSGDEPGKLRGLSRQEGMISWMMVGLIAAGVLALAAALWWWLKRKGIISLKAESKPVIPPEVMAKERLEKIKSEDVFHQQGEKQYYSELTDILRRYLEGRYTINALDRTTHELAKALRQTTCPRAEIVKITELLEFSDLVKFAKAGADEKSVVTHWKVVWDFVEMSTPQIVSDDTTT